MDLHKILFHLLVIITSFIQVDMLTNTTDCHHYTSVNTTGVIHYINNLSTSLCTWTIVAQPSNKIKIEFEEFNITSSNRCHDAYVSWIESDQRYPYGHFCNRIQPPQYISNTNILKVNIYTRNPKDFLYFKLRYDLIKRNFKSTPNYNWNFNRHTILDLNRSTLFQNPRNITKEEKKVDVELNSYLILVPAIPIISIFLLCSIGIGVKNVIQDRFFQTRNLDEDVDSTEGNGEYDSPLRSKGKTRLRNGWRDKFKRMLKWRRKDSDIDTYEFMLDQYKLMTATSMRGKRSSQIQLEGFSSTSPRTLARKHIALTSLRRKDSIDFGMGSVLQEVHSLRHLETESRSPMVNNRSHMHSGLKFLSSLRDSRPDLDDNLRLLPFGSSTETKKPKFVFRPYESPILSKQIIKEELADELLALSPLSLRNEVLASSPNNLSPLTINSNNSPNHDRVQSECLDELKLIINASREDINIVKEVIPSCMIDIVMPQDLEDVLLTLEEGENINN